MGEGGIRASSGLLSYMQKFEEMSGDDKLIEGLKSTIRVLENEKKELEKQLSDKKAEIEAKIISDIFLRVNSKENDFLLDKIVMINNSLKRKRKQTELIIFTELLINFIEKLGIKKILNPGEVITITKRDILNYNYIGKPFKRRKKVKVISPGWKFKQNIFAQPTVK